MKSSVISLLSLAALSSAHPKWQSWTPTSSVQGYPASTGDSGSGSPYSPQSSSKKSKYSSEGGDGSYKPTASPTHGGDSQTYGSGASEAGNPTQTGGSVSSTPAGSTTPPPTNGTTSINSTVSSGGITLPAGCSSKNGIGVGWLPDADHSIPLSDITSALGNSKPCFVGFYGQITSSNWDGSQLTSKIEQAKAGGAPYPIFVASVMPYVKMSEVPAAKTSITKVMNELTDAGLTVWLRFAHEMNWYDSAAAGYVYPQSSVADYQTAWKAVSDAVADNANVKMFWSPNSASADKLKSDGWYPTSGKVDVIGVDIYPDSQKSFSDVYGSFCSGWDVLFSIGETGKGGSSADKTYWLQQLSSPEAKTACPNYVGFSYFEYNKEADFRVVTGGNTEAKSVLF